MLQTGAGVFLQIPNGSDKRVLIPATITDVTESTYSVQLENDDTAFSPGQEVFLFFERKNEFMQQSARIDGVLAGAPKPLLGIQAVGEPVSAESRQCYRVSTVMAELTATVGGDEKCRLTDVSATGFSVVSRMQFDLGKTLPVTLRFEKVEFKGHACVQSGKETDAGEIRYGLHCVGNDKETKELAKGLQKISMAVQRQQLRRMARGA